MKKPSGEDLKMAAELLLEWPPRPTRELPRWDSILFWAPLFVAISAMAFRLMPDDRRGGWIGWWTGLPNSGQRAKTIHEAIWNGTLQVLEEHREAYRRRVVATREVQT